MNNLLQIPLIHVRGTARQMGRSHGEACANAIHELYHLRLQNALNHVHRLNKRPVQEKEYLDIARLSLQLLATRHLDTYLEVIGIAEGAQIEKEKLYALQGLTDFRDVLTWPSMNEACTALYLSNCRTQFQRPVSAQTWDLAHDNMPYVIALIREPTDGLKTATLTVTGGLNMAGLNEAGLGILTTNLKSFNSQIGLPYLSLMHLALKCKKLTHATRRIIDSTRSGAHFYLLADAESKFNALEVLPHNYRNLKTSDNYIVHTNHILHSDLINQQASPTSNSSFERLLKAKSLATRKHHDIRSIKEILSDRSRGNNSINRKNGPDKVSTNGAVIIDHEERRLHLCRSYPELAKWECIQL